MSQATATSGSSRRVKVKIEPELGMGVTLSGYSDRHPATIVEISQEHGRTYITVQEDNAVRTDSNGFSESQEYDYFPNPKGTKHTYRLHKNGCWEYIVMNEKTQYWNKKDGNSIYIGDREKYYDHSF